MPAYNAEKTIKASINSIKAQTFCDWELIVVDDGSQDATPLIVKAFVDEDPRIQLVMNERNMGVSVTRNTGIAHAKGQWIAFLDSDDLWQEDKLDKQLKFMEANKAVISYTSTAYIDKAGYKSSFILRAKHKLSYKQLLRRNIMSCSSVMLCREVIARYPFPEGHFHEDYVVWLNVLREIGYAYGLDEPLLLYRLSSESKSGNRVGSGLMVFGSYRAVGYGPVVSMFMTLRYAFHSIIKRRKIGKGWAREQKP